MKKLVSIISLLSILCSANATEYLEGQLWAYKTRIGEESSTVLINKIDTDQKLGKIFHISIFGVKVKNRHVAGDITKILPHFPVSKETLDKSLTQLTATRYPYMDFLKGYIIWKNAFQSGNAGIFTIPVSEIIEIVEEQNNKQ